MTKDVIIEINGESFTVGMRDVLRLIWHLTRGFAAASMGYEVSIKMQFSRCDHECEAWAMGVPYQRCRVCEVVE